MYAIFETGGKQYKAENGAVLFVEKLNVAEDPVCGSGHCHIIPYWTGVKGSDSVVAYQASRRGGTLYCRKVGQRIKMSGKAVTYSVAEIMF